MKLSCLNNLWSRGRLNEKGQDDLAYDRAESAAIRATAVAKFGSICGDGAFGSRFHEKTTNDDGVSLTNRCIAPGNSLSVVSIA